MDVVITAHLARRGFQAVRQSLPDGSTPTEVDPEILDAINRLQSPGTVVVLVITFLVFGFIDFVIEYSIRFVIANLAAVEDVASDSFHEFELGGLLNEDEPEREVPGGKLEYEDGRVSVDEGAGGTEDRHKLLNSEQTMEGSGQVQRSPITRTLRTSFRHLYSIGGYRSIFRGVKAHLVMLVIFLGTVIALDYLIVARPRFIGRWIAFFTSLLILTPLHCAWTHATIRANSQAPKTNGLYSSAPSTAGWKRLIPGVWSAQPVLPMIRYIASFLLLTEGTRAIAHGVMAGLPQDSLHPAIVIGLSIFMPLLFAAPAGLLVVLPSFIALIRAEASLLPESDQAIVPFDRSFSGRSINWRSGGVSWWRYIWLNLGPLGSFAAFDREAYFRVLSVFFKLVPMLVVLFGLYLLVIGLELHAILGDRIRFMPIILKSLAASL